MGKRVGEDSAQHRQWAFIPDDGRLVHFAQDWMETGLAVLNPGKFRKSGDKLITLANGFLQQERKRAVLTEDSDGIALWSWRGPLDSPRSILRKLEFATAMNKQTNKTLDY